MCRHRSTTYFVNEVYDTCSIYPIAFEVYLRKEEFQGQNKKGEDLNPRLLSVDIEILFYPPKSSKCNISRGTPKLSSIFSTAFDIGPGPHM